jgi:hypothetical protein
MDAPTPILADNQGAVRPTRRMQHVEMKHFIILLQWTDDKSSLILSTHRQMKTTVIL